MNWLWHQGEQLSRLKEAPQESEVSLPLPKCESSPTRTSVILSILSPSNPRTLGDISDALKEADLQTPRVSLLELLDLLVQQEQVIRDWGETGCRVYFLNKKPPA
ncbi:hypothetical protein [Leptolyngbya boryana]|uniref:hypothetical protein n=1 Tax=Leptolyngbya boryana TaxID=1184 RepID=UPI00039FB9CD|nr:hypothetical protein [Leptolyngbya boryana]ULP29622.1 hypothetical protein MCP04_26930 [Leptolyngbya boryana IU 594]